MINTTRPNTRSTTKQSFIHLPLIFILILLKNLHLAVTKKDICIVFCNVMGEFKEILTFVGKLY